MKLKQNGVINTLLIPLVLVSILFIVAVVFGYQMYNSRQDYKNNVEAKIQSANQVVIKQTQNTDAAQYADEAKRPLATYTGPSAFGSVVIKYPKTWSAYVIEQNQGNPINGYFDPGFVPDVNNQNSSYALRVEVLTQPYNSVLSNYTEQAQQGTVSISPYSPANISPKFGVTGTEISGQIFSQKQGTMVILPFPGNDTFELWTESSRFLSDFNKYILPNYTFSP